MVIVELHGEKGCFHKPYDHSVLSLILELPGRKAWKNEATYFKVTPSTIRMIKENLHNVKFIDDGEMKKQDEFENLPCQNSDIPELVTDYVPKLPWFPIQKVTLKQSHDRHVFAHLHDPGAGKTAIMIAEFGILYMTGKITGVLISAPNKVDTQWINEQIPKHLSTQFKTKATVWDKKPLNKFWGNKNRLEIIATNIESFRTKKGQQMANDFIEAHDGNVMMIVDESHEIQNFKSKQTQGIIETGHKCAYRRIATGTLLGKSLFDAFSQFYFLDPKIFGHQYMSSFKSEFCIVRFERRFNPVTKKKYGKAFPVIRGNKNETKFWSLIAPHSYRVDESEIRGGKKTSNVQKHTYTIDDATKKIYQEVAETAIAEIDNEIVLTIKAGLSLELRLSQILCGFLPKQDGTYINISNQRLVECEKIIRKIKEDGPIIIWVCFIHDFYKIEKYFKKQGYRVGIYRGTKKHCAEQKEKFLNGDLDLFVVNPMSGGTGENFQGDCLHDIYYSYNDNQWKHWQSLFRIDRKGAKAKVTHHFLSASKSVNVKTLQRFNSKKGMGKRSIDDIRKAIAYGISQEKSKTKISQQDLEVLGL